MALDLGLIDQAKSSTTITNKKIFERGQITVPKSLREQLRLHGFVQVDSSIIPFKVLKDIDFFWDNVKKKTDFNDNYLWVAFFMMCLKKGY